MVKVNKRVVSICLRESGHYVDGLGKQRNGFVCIRVLEHLGDFKTNLEAERDED